MARRCWSGAVSDLAEAGGGIRARPLRRTPVADMARPGVVVEGVFAVSGKLRLSSPWRAKRIMVRPRWRKPHRHARPAEMAFDLRNRQRSKMERDAASTALAAASFHSRPQNGRACPRFPEAMTGTSTAFGKRGVSNSMS